MSPQSDWIFSFLIKNYLGSHWPTQLSILSLLYELWCLQHQLYIILPNNLYITFETQLILCYCLKIINNSIIFYSYDVLFLLSDLTFHTIIFCNLIAILCYSFKIIEHLFHLQEYFLFIKGQLIMKLEFVHFEFLIFVIIFMIIFLFFKDLLQSVLSSIIKMFHINVFCCINYNYQLNLKFVKYFAWQLFS